MLAYRHIREYREGQACTTSSIILPTSSTMLQKIKDRHKDPNQQKNMKTDTQGSKSTKKHED